MREMWTCICSKTGFQTLLFSFSTAFVLMFQLGNRTFTGLRQSHALCMLLAVPIRTKPKTLEVQNVVASLETYLSSHSVDAGSGSARPPHPLRCPAQIAGLPAACPQQPRRQPRQQPGWPGTPSRSGSRRPRRAPAQQLPVSQSLLPSHGTSRKQNEPIWGKFKGMVWIWHLSFLNANTGSQAVLQVLM